MVLPLIPFAAGVGIGALITYLMKDERVQRKIVEGARRASGIGHEGLDYLKNAGWPGQASSETAGPQAGETEASASGREAEDASCCGDQAQPVAKREPEAGPEPEGDQVRNW